MANYDSYFVAKQPILDKDLATYGYELLFRSSLTEQKARIDDPDLATVQVLIYGFSKCQEEMKQTKRVFINFTERLLRDGAPRALPPAVTVIEILESTRISPQLLETLIKYKQDGYLLAVDDYGLSYQSPDFLDIADIIKVDVLQRRKEEIEEIFATIANKKALKLAEKVENGESYRFLQGFGFDLFQGYFFARPENISGKKIGSAQLSRIRILAALQASDLEPETIVALITADPSIAYRLLRLLNSAAFGFSMNIESIQHAVALLGITRMRYWLQMVILSDINASGQPQELFTLALLRGKILEELAIDSKISGLKPETFFLFGLLSLLDIMLDTSFGEIFDKLPLSANFQDGYLGQHNTMARYLKLLNAFECNDSKAMTEHCEVLQLAPHAVMQASIRAHAWTESIANDIL